ncbi:MAG: hypothetical protein C0412_17430 [Flavobacterium sp.]|nr:hypothetical protein [Flavobacterium sp.]
MTYQEKNITVALTTYLLIIGYYLVNIFQMNQEGDLVPERLFSLWAIVFIATFIVNIVGSILTNILLSIINAVKKGSRNIQPFIADERDKLIVLKGVRVSYFTFSFGVILSMVLFVLGQSALVMFGMLVFFAIFGELVGSISKIYLYRRGF